MLRSFYRKLKEGLDFTGGFFRFMVAVPDQVNLTKKHGLDAGLDLYAAQDGLLYPGERGLISTGIQVEILPGYVGLVFARSGLAVNQGIMVGAGVIDSPYRGEVKVLLFNMGTESFRISHGDRIAQLLTVPVNLGLYEEVDWVSGTERGSDGFGSSGR